MKTIADETILFESPDPAGIYCYSPALCHGFNGRIIAALDLGGPGTTALPGRRSTTGDAASGNQVRIFFSDDKGNSWRQSSSTPPMLHENLFQAGNALYLLGHSGKLVISRSDDNGATWSEPVTLEGEHRYQDGVGRIDHWNGRVYASYGRSFEAGPWSMPMVLSAPEDADLTRRESWTFSDPFDPRPILEAARAGGIPSCIHPGVIEANLVRIHDPGHEFYDPEMKTLMILMRTAAERISPVSGNLAAMLRCVERPGGKLVIERVVNREGFRLFYLPWPGGGIKFYLDYDPESRFYWMVASEIDGRYNPRRRLGLYYSADLFNWTSAGLIAAGPADHAARNYATLLIDGSDLLVLARSGDLRARSDHDNNLTTFHRIRDFRKLVTE